jgi:hypothetical protein
MRASSKRLTVLLLLFAAIQLYLIVRVEFEVPGDIAVLREQFFDTDGAASENLHELNNNTTTYEKIFDYSTTTKTYYPCFPSRQQYSHQHPQSSTTTIIYLDTAHVNLHYETYYTFIHHLCTCNAKKDPHWIISSNKIPQFYIGPDEMLTVGFEKVLEEYNTTTCGPLFFGKPPTNPHLTIMTTSYPAHFEPTHQKQYHKLINDPRYIFICHEDAPQLENVTNVFFLTPRHNRYIIPSFFPPTIVKRHSRSIHQQHPEEPPIFLVMGSFNNIYRRNLNSLQYPLKVHRDRKFTVRFLGGSSASASNEYLAQLLRDKFPDDDNKIQLLPRMDTYDFMVSVAEADVILPLVEGGNFHADKGYQGGKKLTSSVMWGLGFHKKMVLYRPLAELFGIEEDNTTYFLHGDSTMDHQAFYEAFTNVLTL